VAPEQLEHDPAKLPVTPLGPASAKSITETFSRPPTATPLASVATTTSTATTPEAATCVTCGVIVSEKVRDYCVQHAARFGGRIYCFKHQSTVRAVPAN